MCGIFALFGNSNTENLDNMRNYYLNLSKKLRHRGPDWNGIYISDNVTICHERLSIVGVEQGSQPINDNDNRAIHRLYKRDINKLKNFIIGGRLADYAYYDMDMTISAALVKFEYILKNFK